MENFLGKSWEESAKKITGVISKHIYGRTFKAIPKGFPTGLSKVILGGFLKKIPARKELNIGKNWNIKI